MRNHEFAPITNTVLSFSSMRGIDHTSIEGNLGFIVGLLERSRRLLSALLFLYENKYADCSDALCRSILEHCATGFWLLEDVEANFDIVLRAHLRDLRLLIDAGSKHAQKSYTAFLSLVKEHCGETVGETKLPPLKKRLVGPLSQREAVYRELCGRVHSSILSSALGFSAIIDTKSQPHLTEDEFTAGYLPFATILVWGLAVQLFARLKRPELKQLLDMAGVFEDYTKMNGQGAWSLK